MNIIQRTATRVYSLPRMAATRVYSLPRMAATRVYSLPRLRHRFTMGQAGAIRVRKKHALATLALLVMVYVTTMLMTSHYIPEEKPVEPEPHDVALCNLNLTWSQECVDKFASTLKITHSVQAITLSNGGDEPLPPYGWFIFFTSIRRVFDVKGGLDVTHINGALYRLAPNPEFARALEPGHYRYFPYTQQCCKKSVSDFQPNWYFSINSVMRRDADMPLEPLEPRLIESTRSGSHVSPMVSPDSWTAQQRYRYNNIPNLGRHQLPVIPTPREFSYFPREEPSLAVDLREGQWRIKVSEQSHLKNEANYLSSKLNIPVESSLSPEQLSNTHAIVFDEVEVDSDGVNDYVLHVGTHLEKYIALSASTPAGAFYAVQTLLSLIDRGQVYANMHIRDGPRFKYRGFMLDVARNFHDKGTVLKYLDLMAMYKMNKLHLHLTDDEGWRLEIPGLPELTQVGGRRCHDNKNCIVPGLGSGPFANTSGSGFYTIEDYKHILSYAKARHIEVIPEIDLPGHAHAAIVSMESRYERLRKAGKPKKALYYRLRPEEIESDESNTILSIQRFKNNVLNPCLESTFNFVEAIIDALYILHKDISPLRIVHLGGDEVPTGSMDTSSICHHVSNQPLGAEDWKEYSAEEWLKYGAKSWQEYFSLRVARLLKDKYNLNLASWEEGLLHKNAPISRDRFPNEEVLSYTWNNAWQDGGARNPALLANAGYHVVLTPSSNLYLDHPQEPDPVELGLSWSVPYADIYMAYRLMPDNFYWSAMADVKDICKSTRSCPPFMKPGNIQGIQATLFGEYLRDKDILDHMALPRLLAVAERAWHKAPWEIVDSKDIREEQMRKDYVKFANTLGHKELGRLDDMGFTYRVPPPGGMITDGKLKTNVDFPGLKVESSLDGGLTWYDAPHHEVVGNATVWLRTRSADGKRHSRTVKVTQQRWWPEMIHGSQ